MRPRQTHSQPASVRHTGTSHEHRGRPARQPRAVRPAVAYRRRPGRADSSTFSAPETWHNPLDRKEIEYVVEHAGAGYRHVVTSAEVAERLALLPREFVRQVEVVQLSGITRKRKLFPCYGMQWGPNVYLYPMEESLRETYYTPPRPQSLIETRMYGGQWIEGHGVWYLQWTEAAIRDFYLNNVLIHEVGHVLDQRNRRSKDREQYANWFAIEYGYRPSRGRA